MGHELAVVAAAPSGVGAPAPVSVGAPAPTSLAPGFRFHPTDEELVRYYLRRKVCAKPFRFQAVVELDVYKSEPWELAEHSSLKTRDQEWYFFSPVDRKYGNGSRLNRATGKGYWKATGKDRPVRHKNLAIGMKKTLVFHSGRAPDGKRTNWVMHEYRMCDLELERAGVTQDSFVLCRIFQKSGLGPPNGDRYAPFLDEEWDDDETSLVVPGGDVEDESTDPNQEPLPLTMAPPQVENPVESLTLPFMCKRERSSEDPKLLTLSPTTKRSKSSDPNPSQANGSEDSTTQDPPQMIMTKNFPLTLSALPLLENGEPKEKNAIINSNNNNQPTFDSSDLEKSVPPGYLKFISNLENEIINVSMERETLKIEMMRAQAMINVLQSRIEILAQENDEFRRRG